MTDMDQLAEAILEAKQKLSELDELLTDAMDALSRAEQETMPVKILSEPSDTDGSTACR